MIQMIWRILVVTLLACTVGGAYASPTLLSDVQMDQVSAGGQYSFVEGAGSVANGVVIAQAKTKAVERDNGTSITKASLKIKAVGTDVDAYGYGESGADGIVTAGYGAGSVDEGKVIIRVKTVAKVKADGEVISKTKVQVRSVETRSAVTGVSATARF